MKMENQKIFRLMVIFPFLGGTAIGGFGVVRLLSAEYLIALFDFAVAISFYALGVYTYITGKETAARYISAIISVIGPLIFIRQFDTGGIYWVYSSTIIIFYLVEYRWAIAFNILMLFGVAAIYWNVDYSPVQLYAFLVTIGLINMFSLLFALNEAKNKEMLRALSVKDELSGVGNRRAFDERVRETISVRKRYGASACLICLDIDRFKSVNDSLGHGAGDKVIRSLASIIESMVRESDHVFRIGGDEFVIIADASDVAPAMQLAEKIRRSVEEASMLAGRQLTISLGVAMLQDGDTPESWLARADAELYKAKEAGRNCSSVDVGTMVAAG